MEQTEGMLSPVSPGVRSTGLGQTGPGTGDSVGRPQSSGGSMCLGPGLLPPIGRLLHVAGPHNGMSPPD